MTWLLQRLFGRLPIGWLQLSHRKARLAAAASGVAFANLLVFMQLGILGAMETALKAPYGFFDADIMISSTDANTLTDGSNVARTRLFQALDVPGVASGALLFIGNLEFRLPNGTSSVLQTFALKPEDSDFVVPALAGQFGRLRIENTALIDTATRGVAPEVFDKLKEGTPFPFEVNGRTLTAVGTLQIGGGFAADGTLFVSDQTFFRFFGNRSSAAPNHILLKVDDGVSVDVVLARLQTVLPADVVTARTISEFANADFTYQTTERPVGIIFGFGVIIGIIVGIVILYQVLSTDVANHLPEYATFKAMGYGQKFFLGIVLEEAVILGLFGFVPGFLVAQGLYFAMGTATGLPLNMEYSRIVMVFFGTLAASVLSGAIATRRLAAADPADLF